MHIERENNFYRKRNSFLSIPDEQLIKFCRIENFQDSGKGGQKRNRKYSAVRLTHIETGMTSECTLFREQNLNRIEAGRKLRLKIALNFFGDPIIVENIRGITSLSSVDYPLWVAFILDELYKYGFELSPLSEELSISKSKLIKLLYRDRELWQKVNEKRVNLGKYQLTV